MSESIEHEAVRGVLGGWVAGTVSITAADEFEGAVYGSAEITLTESEWQKFLADRATPGTEAFRAKGKDAVTT